jgi:Pectinacetylesterase
MRNVFCVGCSIVTLLAVGCGGTDQGLAAGDGGAPGNTGPKISVPPGDPVHVEPITWKAIPVEGTFCRDGMTAGFGISINPSSDKLLIYLEGGGACFNATTCAMNPASWPVADSTVANFGTRFIFNRSLAANPFKDWNMVYVPYCSGDVHSGTNMSGYMGQPQTGYTNYFKYLQRFIATFPNLKQVVLSGVSAGGFGVTWNWALTQDAFGEVPVFGLDDSGPPMGPMYLEECQQARTGALWGWAQSLHPACTECDVAAGKVTLPSMDMMMKRTKGRRFGLLSYDEDAVIKIFIGFGQNGCAAWDTFLPPPYPAGKYPMGLAELRQRWSSSPDAALYVVSGSGHTFLGSDLSTFRTGDLTMLDWVKNLVDNAPGWTSVMP